MTLGWFPLVLAYIFTNSLSKILQKIAVEKEEVDPKAFCVAFLFFSGLLTFPFLAIEPVQLPPDYRGWLALAIACLGAGVYMVLYYHGIQGTEVSQAETIATTRAIWSMIFGVLLFQETISASKLIGAFLIMIAIVIIYWHKGEFRNFSRPHWMILAYAFMITAGYALDKYCMGFFSVAAYQIILYMGSAGVTLIIFPGTWQKMKPFLRWNNNSPIFIACFALQAISSLAILRAYQVGGAFSVVGPMAQTTTLVTIFLGIFLLQEKWNLGRKLTGIAIAAIGIIFLRLFNF